MSRRKLLDLVFWASATLMVVAFVAWQWQPAHEFAWKYDEGVNALKARLFLEGYSLYSEVWTDQPPLFTLLIAATFTLFGQSVFVARALVLVLSGRSASRRLDRSSPGRQAGGVGHAVTAGPTATLPTAFKSDLYRLARHQRRIDGPGSLLCLPV